MFVDESRFSLQSDSRQTFRWRAPGTRYHQFWVTIDTEFVFMNDNTLPHYADIGNECLQSEDFTRMDWSAFLLDSNPEEHVRDMLDSRIAESF
ncbi:transposable element Tc3 transposase [Trichonephila clavipes]|nr:transposable element Tc3 transposase [Trichonephila clavipes]